MKVFAVLFVSALSFGLLGCPEEPKADPSKAAAKPAASREPRERDRGQSADRAPGVRGDAEEGRRFREDSRLGQGDGAFRVARAGAFVIVDCLLDHELLIRRVNERGLPLREGEVRIRHDGPIFGFDAAARGDALVIAAGSVEDHPLDRSEGSFGYIDSFVFLYEASPGLATAVKKLAEVNVSELGVITPKALRLEVSPGEIRVRAAGYGGGKLATLVWKGNSGGAPETSAIDVPPGITAIAFGPEEGACALASPLLDAWITVDKEGNSTVTKASGGVGANPTVNLGEALFFTSLMAPWNKTEGRLSTVYVRDVPFRGVHRRADASHREGRYPRNHKTAARAV